MSSLLKKISRLYHSGTLGLAIKGEIGGWVSRLGKITRIESIIHNPWTYAIFHRISLETAPTIVQGILESFPNIKSVVDFGCGTGVYISEFKKRSITAEGFEYSPVARRIALNTFDLKIGAFDVKTFVNMEKRFDLAVCIQVAEYLTPELGDRLVDICCQHAPLVIFSSRQPGERGIKPINPQPKSYWIERFAKRDFCFNRTKTDHLEHYLRANLTRGFWIADDIGIYEKINH